MNKYLENLNKIEFVVTNACTGRCKHCSEGDHKPSGKHIDGKSAADAVRRISSEYKIKTVMTFGGEPLLYPSVVEEIMLAARACNVEKRQVITNGYFSKKCEEVKSIAERLYRSGVNDLLLSVDAFHQEFIPLDAVRLFAKACVDFSVPVRLQPAWLVKRTADNEFNRKTVEILKSLSDLGIPTSDGNVVFFEGNAKKYLAEYFDKTPPENPYIEDPCNVKCLSFSENGDLFCENIYKTDVMEILEKYHP